jgi:glucose/arabinose dehydrogenase
MVLLAVVALLATACAAKKPSKAPSPSSATPATSTATATVTATASPPTATASPASPPRSATPATPKPSPPSPPSPPPPPAPAAPPPLTGPPASAFPIAANFPTALAFAPDGRLFWTERAGNVMVYQNGAPRVFARVSTVTTESGGGYSERGLLGLAISPTFTSDHFVYAFYSDANRSTQHVVRWTDSGGTGTAPATLVTLPAGGDCCHKGGRLAFGPTDGKLYVTLGEEHNPGQAQNVGSPLGKVLRYNADGSVPADDPFAAQGSAVWAYGFRNPFGLAISASGQVALTMNGPTGDGGSPSTGYDTVIFSVRRGGDYQWPECYGYSHPLAADPCPGSLIAPDYSTEASTLVPTGATFVDDAGPAGPAGHLVFCTFNHGGMIFTPGSPHGSVAPGPANCRLDVKQGPDHALYYSDTGHIHRG